MEGGTDYMPFGPIEFIVLHFPGNRFTGEIVPALQELVDNGTVRILDFMCVMKDEDGTMLVVQSDDLGDTVAAVLQPLVTHDEELFSKSDARHFAQILEQNSSAAMILFENTWATRFTDAVRNAQGEVILNERVPWPVIEEVLAEAAAELR
jgi:hypothetical protein